MTKLADIEEKYLDVANVAHQQILNRPVPTESVAKYIIARAIQSAVNEERKSAFNSGYLIACCNISNGHGEECIASDVLAESGISEDEVAAMGLSEYDAEALKKIRAARKDDPIQSIRQRGAKP